MKAAMLIINLALIAATLVVVAMLIRLDRSIQKDVETTTKDILRVKPDARIPKPRLFESRLHYWGRLLDMWTDALKEKWGDTIMEDGRPFRVHLDEIRRKYVR